MNNKEVIEKVKKILALAENNPNENEALAAALKAQKMMAKFHIQEEDLRDEVTESTIDSIVAKHNGKTAKWRLSLALVIAANFRCRVYIHNGKDVCFMGYKEDAMICKEVFLSMYSIGEKLSNKLKRETRKSKGTATGVKNTFCCGFVDGIKSELEKQCTALVLIVPKEVNEAFEAKMSNVKRKKVSLKISNDSEVYNTGFVSGKNSIQARAIENK